MRVHIILLTIKSHHATHKSVVIKLLLWLQVSFGEMIGCDKEDVSVMMVVMVTTLFAVPNSVL